MIDELERNRERVRQARAARIASIGARAVKVFAAGARLGTQHQPGDQVFDAVSGEIGEVVDVRRENVVVPVAR